MGKTIPLLSTCATRCENIRRSIGDELGRIEETYKSEYEIAKKRQDEAEKGLAALISQSTGDESGASSSIQSSRLLRRATARSTTISFSSIRSRFSNKHFQSLRRGQFRQRRLARLPENVAGLAGGDICWRDARGRISEHSGKLWTAGSGPGNRYDLVLADRVSCDGAALDCSFDDNFCRAGSR